MGVLEQIRPLIENQRATFVFPTGEYYVHFQLHTTNEIAGLENVHLLKALIHFFSLYESTFFPILS